MSKSAGKSIGLAERVAKSGGGQLDVNTVELAERIMSGKTTLGQEAGINERQLEGIYAIAYNLFQGKKYDDAIRCFQFLCLFNPMCYKYVYGIASCFQKKKEYEAAVLFFMLSGSLDQVQPAPHLHMAECLMLMDEKENAIQCLGDSLKLAGDKPQYASIRDRAKVMQDNLSA